MTDPVLEKAVRIAEGGCPRVLDLFAGCGGLSLGFHAAGYHIVAGVELDPLAAESHAENLFRHEDEVTRQLHGKARDITQISPSELLAEFGIAEYRKAVDIVIGGPPCQAYARVGRAKLREIAEHPEAFKIDPRADLYLRYLHYIKELAPLAILMENVPDILNHGGRVIPEEMRETLGHMGYEVKYSLLNAAFYGVPQLRDRVFLIAYHKTLKQEVVFPDPTHYWKLTSGYLGTRDVAFKNIDMFVSGFMAAKEPTSDLPNAVTATEAIGDLPPWTQRQRAELKRGTRRFNEFFPYRSMDEVSDYAKRMRDWAGFKSEGGIYDHVIRSLPRDGDIFRNMDWGDEYPAAHKVAIGLFEAEAKRLGLAQGGKEYTKLHRKMVPPYPVHNFPNRWWKLHPDRPVRTLMAHIGKDTYSHIHYDSRQARCISVREAARLQSFPDAFVFSGTMNPAYRQIGNAVPPLMANALAKEMREALISAASRLSMERQVA